MSTGKMTSGSKMKADCVKLGLYLYFKNNITSGAHQAAYDEMQGGELNFIEGHPDNIIAILDSIINSTEDKHTTIDSIPSIKIDEDKNPILDEEGKIIPVLLLNQSIEVKPALEALKEKCIAYSKPAPVEPVVTETIILEPNTNQTTYQLTFTETLTQNVNVKIMQRYGSSTEDLTEWHYLANFHNVKYKQNDYQVRIPATTQAVRELKVVADKTINMTITVV